MENENPKTEALLEVPPDGSPAEPEPLKCERCESDTPAKVYDPRIAKQPNKRIALCDECAAKDPQSVLDESPEEPTEPEQETIVTPKSTVPKAGQNKAEHIETKPIDRVDIENNIKSQEKDVDALLKSRQEIQQKLMQVNKMITAKMGAIAGLRDLLGNA